MNSKNIYINHETDSRKKIVNLNVSINIKETKFSG